MITLLFFLFFFLLMQREFVDHQVYLRYGRLKRIFRRELQRYNDERVRFTEFSRNWRFE